MTKPKKNPCGATFDTDDGTHECVLADGHGGLVHRDADGREWGDIRLTEPTSSPVERGRYA